MKAHKLIVICSIFFTTIFFINNHLAEAQDQIRYVGSSTVGVFMKEAAKVYKKATFTINTNPESGGGETAAAHGKTDIGGVAREVKPEIINKGVKKFLIGKDAIGVWVNADNPVKSLTIEELRNIFSGKIVSWKDLNGKDIPITAYIVNPQSATRKVFQKHVMNRQNYAGKTIRTIRPDPAILDKVAADKGGIGQLSFAIGTNHPVLKKVKKISIGNQAASVNNQNYPVTRPLYLITKGEPKGAVRDFINWAISDQGQTIVKKYFVGR